MPTYLSSSLIHTTVLLVLLLLLVFAPIPSQGFASWLKCFVDLDPSEVIMFHKVVPATEARHEVYIEVQPYGRGDAWLSVDKQGDFLQLPAAFPNAPLTLRVRLHVPPALQSQDVQFIIEAKTSIADEAAESVEFIDKGLMCDGSRAFSRRHDEHVILQIDTNLHPDLEYVTLTAGWAADMEAVTLTPILTMKPAAPVADEGGDFGSNAPAVYHRGNDEL